MSTVPIKDLKLLLAWLLLANALQWPDVKKKGPKHIQQSATNGNLQFSFKVAILFISFEIFLLLKWFNVIYTSAEDPINRKPYLFFSIPDVCSVYVT